MVGHRIRRLPVMDGGQLVGIVTLDDIAVRTGNLEVAQQMTADVARAVVARLLLPPARRLDRQAGRLPTSPEHLAHRLRLDAEHARILDAARGGHRHLQQLGLLPGRERGRPRPPARRLAGRAARAERHVHDGPRRPTPRAPASRSRRR